MSGPEGFRLADDPLADLVVLKSAWAAHDEVAGSRADSVRWMRAPA